MSSSIDGCSVQFIDKQKNNNKEKNEVVMANKDFVEVASMQDSTIKLKMLKYQLSSKIVKDSVDGETLTISQTIHDKIPIAIFLLLRKLTQAVDYKLTPYTLW